MTGTLFRWGDFKSSAGNRLRWKIDCDALTDEDIQCIAGIIAANTDYGIVVSVPTGGDRLEKALPQYTKPDAPYNTLIVDDVLTTGTQMEAAKKKLSEWTLEDDIIGWVIFARTEPPDWINAIFTLGKGIT